MRQTAAIADGDFAEAGAGRPRDSRRDAGATVGLVFARNVRFRRGARHGFWTLVHSDSSGSSEFVRIACSASRIVSSSPVSGAEITYAPLAHFPRSIKRQRSLQKGKSASVFLTGFLQMGQRSFTERLRGILDCRGQRSDCRGKNRSAKEVHLCNLTSNLWTLDYLRH